ncbi:MAG: ArnT family glycosyltransferase [Bryobacteraceae bacterium]
MENPDLTSIRTLQASSESYGSLYVVVLILSSFAYLGCIVSPPSLMDDVDAVQAQIAQNMRISGDWVTARLDGVPYLEKPPLIYWLIALSYKIFGPEDWTARIPIALSAIGLCLLLTAFGRWAFGERAGFYAGLCISTCVGLFLFTRILIPDVMLTLTISLAMWAFLRVLDEGERHPRLWAFLLACSFGVGLLLKSMIGVLFPLAAAFIYLVVTRQALSRAVWKRFHPWMSVLVIILIAAPWHVLAVIRNPPWSAFTLRSAPGEYHGFFWFFFINEQLLRFLDLRYPRDYNTVPRLYFWLFHLIWLFPWSSYLPAVAKLSFRPADRAGRTRLLALCWIGFVLVFFSFSTTQEYYSMPIYPALALLLGSAMANENERWITWGTRALAVLCGCAALSALVILAASWHNATPADISAALSHNPNAYTLSLGHMEDLTLQSFAYLRLPLALAAAAFGVGAATASFRAKRAFLAAAIMMVLFFHAARLAMVVFDPYLSSRPLANALLNSPPGKLIVDHHYYTFSSVFFYAQRNALLLNGRFANLVYGSYAPGAPDVFIDDLQFTKLWLEPERWYIVAMANKVPHFAMLVGKEKLDVVASSGGKVLLTNRPL